MFVAMSRFAVLNGMESEVSQAFKKRPHLVDQEPGFIKMEVLSPVDKSNEFILLTYWDDEASWQAWHHSEAYKHSHKDIPDGLKLVSGSTALDFFHVISR